VSRPCCETQLCLPTLILCFAPRGGHIPFTLKYNQSCIVISAAKFNS